MAIAESIDVPLEQESRRPLSGQNRYRPFADKVHFASHAESWNQAFLVSRNISGEIFRAASHPTFYHELEKPPDSENLLPGFYFGSRLRR